MDELERDLADGDDEVADDQDDDVVSDPDAEPQDGMDATLPDEDEA